jgi:arsenate reductase
MEIWHNPRCSKSRQTLALLEERGAAPEVRRYLDEPPTADQLDAALRALGLEPWELARMGEARAQELGLAELPHDREAWIETMVANPILIERPIVLTDSGARLGRPPESVLDLLG